MTAIWWACIIGFLVGCFSLMWVSISLICLTMFFMYFVQNEMPASRYVILYGSDEGSKAPYFVRNANKYPDLLPQPGIKIDCVSVTLNSLIVLQRKKLIIH